MTDFFTMASLVFVVGSGIRLATPFLLAGLGETIGQRSGVLNLGVDGVMLLGAFGAYWTILETRSPVTGVLVGLAVGLVMGIVYGVVTVTLRAEQGVSGIGIFLFGLGMSDLLFQKKVGTPLPIRGFADWHVPVLSDIPKVGEMFFQHSVLVYLAFLLVPVVAFLLNRTTFGLNVRAVGENPAAADSLGVSVARVRYTTILARCWRSSWASSSRTSPTARGSSPSLSFTSGRGGPWGSWAEPCCSGWSRPPCSSGRPSAWCRAPRPALPPWRRPS